MQIMVTVPESVLDYMSDRAIRSIVDHLLSQPDHVIPSELEWDEVRAYHEAWLSAQKVKTDYALFLIDLWEAIWQPALERHEIKARHAWTLEEMEEGCKPNRRDLWGQWFYRWFSITHENTVINIYTSLLASVEGGVRISSYMDNSLGEDFSTHLALSNQWELDDDRAWVSKERLLPLKQKSLKQKQYQLDVSRLAQLADELLQAFRQSLIVVDVPEPVIFEAPPFARR